MDNVDPKERVDEKAMRKDEVMFPLWMFVHVVQLFRRFNSFGDHLHFFGGEGWEGAVL